MLPRRGVPIGPTTQEPVPFLGCMEARWRDAGGFGTIPGRSPSSCGSISGMVVMKQSLVGRGQRWDKLPPGTQGFWDVTAASPHLVFSFLGGCLQKKNHKSLFNCIPVAASPAAAPLRATCPSPGMPQHPPGPVPGDGGAVCGVTRLGGKNHPDEVFS